MTLDDEYSLRKSIDSYYLVDNGKTYSKLQPSPMDNLLAMYGLEPIAKSLARHNQDGSKGVKLRKSYKNHIQDLPGKHQVLQLKPIPAGLLDPAVAQAPDNIKEIDPALLTAALQFDKTLINGIPGINVADLAINDQQLMMRGDEAEGDEYRKNKRKKKQMNGDVKRQNTGIHT